MKDEKVELLLESLIKEIEALSMKVSEIKSDLKLKDSSGQVGNPLTISEDLRSIKIDLLKVVGAMNQTKITEGDQNRLIELRLQLDRLVAKIRKEENTLNYYFSPFSTLITTVIFMIFCFMIGALADRFYYRYQMNRDKFEIEIIEK